MSLRVNNLEPVEEEVVDDADVTIEELRWDPEEEEETWVDVETGLPTYANPRPEVRPGYRDVHVFMQFPASGRLWDL